MNKDDSKWQRTPKMTSNNRDPKKYCDFHRDHGHLTEECIHLKDNIEELIRRGYLAQFKAHSNGNSSRQEFERNDHKPERAEQARDERRSDSRAENSLRIHEIH